MLQRHTPSSKSHLPLLRKLHFSSMTTVGNSFGRSRTPANQYLRSSLRSRECVCVFVYLEFWIVVVGCRSSLVLLAPLLVVESSIKSPGTTVKPV
ncbi:hypothetical protein T11_6294 [Trichinella zimbabwensis]|uniref:Uncharacterized protein n=1 Tax=Trichinella zimbabwensis TaxID=268475 RepID=A0A0V1HP26_9BILA|nr:hypothetical protein T11_6294 [Trichinella zimbabwensis]